MCCVPKFDLSAFASPDEGRNVGGQKADSLRVMFQGSKKFRPAGELSSMVIFKKNLGKVALDIFGTQCLDTSSAPSYTNKS
jgi:hypothetical protein